LVVVAQMSANLFLLYGARKANYNKVTLELDSAKFPLSHAAISAPQLLDCEALLASL
jgi:hypothetical protein